MLDDDLLSHGETPHYHRRCIVSLLSSERDQVVPTLYGRQAIRVGNRYLVVSPNGYVIGICGSTKLSAGLYQTTDCLGVIWSSLTGN